MCWRPVGCCLQIRLVLNFCCLLLPLYPLSLYVSSFSLMKQVYWGCISILLSKLSKLPSRFESIGRATAAISAAAKKCSLCLVLYSVLYHVVSCSCLLSQFFYMCLKEALELVFLILAASIFLEVINFLHVHDGVHKICLLYFQSRSFTCVVSIYD